MLSGCSHQNEIDSFSRSVTGASPDCDDSAALFGGFSARASVSDWAATTQRLSWVSSPAFCGPGALKMTLYPSACGYIAYRDLPVQDWSRGTALQVHVRLAKAMPQLDNRFLYVRVGSQGVLKEFCPGFTWRDNWSDHERVPLSDIPDDRYVVAKLALTRDDAGLVDPDETVRDMACTDSVDRHAVDSLVIGVGQESRDGEDPERECPMDASDPIEVFVDDIEVVSN